MVVRELLQVLVDVAVAVVVVAIAGLRRVREDRGIAVVAVFARRETVGVSVVVAHAPIAVVVDGVAAVQLFGAGVVGRVAIVAVTVFLGVAAGSGTRDLGDVGTAVAVAIGVGVPRGGVDGIAAVHTPAAVVVDAVADLDTAGAHAAVGVVAVFARRVPVVVCVDAGDGAIAVQVDEVGADLDRAGVDDGVGVVAVSGVVDVAGGLIAVHLGASDISVAIAVPVCVPDQFATGVGGAGVGTRFGDA